MFGAMIALVALARFSFRANAILTFWIAYIQPRPFGASNWRLPFAVRGDGGLGLGTIATSTLFLVTILALVVYLAVTRKDQTVTGGGRNVAVRASRRVRT